MPLERFLDTACRARESAALGSRARARERERNDAPVARLQILTVVSEEPVARRPPSGDHATELR